MIQAVDDVSFAIDRGTTLGLVGESGSGKTTVGRIITRLLHPSGKNILKRGSLARRKLKMEFHGKSSHAAAAPEKGINALDAVILSFNNINALRQHLCEDVRIHGVIPDGGEVPNVVPDYASALFYVRARDDEYCDAVLAKVEECARAAALATGCRVELAMQGAYRAIKVDEQLLALFRRNSESLGVVYDSSIDPDRNLGSTDMGDVSHVVPAIHPYLCIGEPDMAGHTREFLQAGMSDKALDTMVVAAKSLAATALDILLQGQPGGAPE
ncbi:MAG: ATP-binding cassette domain-containing protein [Desulfopila sp.]